MNQSVVHRSSQDEQRPVSITTHERKVSSSALRFFLFASIAGICGALSGVAGKAAVATDGIHQVGRVLGLQTTSLDSWAAMLLRFILLGLNAVFTAQMWRYYLKSLSLGSTPVCQIVSTGTNFAASAFMGVLFFREEVSVVWAIGALFVVIGLALVVYGTSIKSRKNILSSR